MRAQDARREEGVVGVDGAADAERGVDPGRVSFRNKREYGPGSETDWGNTHMLEDGRMAAAPCHAPTGKRRGQLGASRSCNETPPLV